MELFGLSPLTLDTQLDRLCDQLFEAFVSVNRPSSILGNPLIALEPRVPHTPNEDRPRYELPYNFYGQWQNAGVSLQDQHAITAIVQRLKGFVRYAQSMSTVTQLNSYPGCFDARIWDKESTHKNPRIRLIVYPSALDGRAGVMLRISYYRSKKPS